MGKKVTLIAGLGVVGVLVTALVCRKELVVHYHCLRLDRAESLGEARHWFAALIADLVQPHASSIIVNHLGRTRPGFTFWVFLSLEDIAEEPQRDFIPVRFGPLLPLVKDLDYRLKQDPELLEAWAHFVRWSGPEEWNVLKDYSQSGQSSGLGEMVLRAIFSPLVQQLDFSTELLDFARKP